MKILVAATLITGHVNPLLSVTRMLVAHGQDVVAVNAGAFGAVFTKAGARFRPFPGTLDRDLSDIDAVFPERKALTPGPEMLQFDFDNVFIEPMTGQYLALRDVLQDFRADLILCDDLFLGTLPMLTGPAAERPAIAHLGVTFLCARRDDGAPAGPGLPPAASEAVCGEYRKLHAVLSEQFLDPAQQHLNSALALLGRGPLAIPMFDAISSLPDLYLQPTVPGFEYPRRDLAPSLNPVA